MTLPLVVGVDGSDSSLQAIDWAVDEAARHGLPLRLVHASLWERYEEAVPSNGVRRPSERVLAEHLVASAAERAERRNPEVKCGTEIVPGGSRPGGRTATRRRRSTCCRSREARRFG